MLKEILAILFFPLSMLCPALSVWVRRIHDTNKSAWLILIPIYNIVLLFIPGTERENRFGLTPLQTIEKKIVLHQVNEREKIAEDLRKQTFINRLETVGATMFAIATTLHEAIELDWITYRTLDEFNRWLWIIGGVMILFPRILKMVNNKEVTHQNTKY